MINLILPPEIKAQITEGLLRAGHNEIGGILMGEQVDQNSFRVTHITLQKKGTFSRFIRKIEDAVGVLRNFFSQNNHNYSRFNYIGEWHSHPFFIPEPSIQDDSTMLGIITDNSVGANFAALLIVKLDHSKNFICTVHTYLPNGDKIKSKATFL